jgi:capsular polysaccharide biosynthesis protein
MELKEAARRILLQHWVLIASLVVAGMVAAAFHAHQSPLYTASTRLVLATDDPKSATEAGSIADTGKAIATSLTQVRRALGDAHVTGRNPVELATNHVSVRALGTSSIVQLSVSDKDAGVAQAVANALAQRVIDVRTDVTTGRLQQVLSNLSQRVDDINVKIASIDQTLDSLSVAIAQTGAPAKANALRATRDDSLRQRDFLTQQRSALESERISVLSSDALRPKASVISAASRPTHHDSSPVAQETILGALLGLVLGIGIAGLIETVRPTLVGGESLAREFNTPLLGTVPAEENERARETLRQIALRVRMAAEKVNAHSVGLVAVGADIELGLLAATLDELANRVSPAASAQRIAAEMSGARSVSSADAETSTRTVEGGSTARCRIRPFGLLDGRPGTDTALVLVSADVAKKEEVDEVSHLLRVAASPLLGLITYERSRERSGRFSISQLRRR